MGHMQRFRCQTEVHQQPSGDAEPGWGTWVRGWQQSEPLSGPFRRPFEQHPLEIKQQAHPFIVCRPISMFRP